MSQKSVLVLGSTGMIGHQIYNYLEKLNIYDLHNIAYRKKLTEDTVLADAMNLEIFLKVISEFNPDYIINCIGILIDKANTNPKDAVFLNAYFPHVLSNLANDIDAKLIHISTDCVFSGNQTIPYIETDIKDGAGIYAKTKSLGEINNEKHLTLRTSVVGPELKEDGEELFHWFMTQSKRIEGYKQSVWSGVTTIYLAKAVNASIKKNISGLHHVTNNLSINKYELLKLFKKYTKKEIILVPVDGTKTNKSFIDTRNVLGLKIPNYEQMIAEMIEVIRENNDLYSQYHIR